MKKVILAIILLTTLLFNGCTPVEIPVTTFPEPLYKNEGVTVFNHYTEDLFNRIKQDEFSIDIGYKNCVDHIYLPYHATQYIYNFYELERYYRLDKEVAIIAYVTVTDFQRRLVDGKIHIPVKINELYYITPDRKSAVKVGAEVTLVEDVEDCVMLSADKFGLYNGYAYFRRGHHYIIYATKDMSLPNTMVINSRVGVIELSDINDIKNFYENVIGNDIPYAEKNLREQILEKYWYKKGDSKNET